MAGNSLLGLCFLYILTAALYFPWPTLAQSATGSSHVSSDPGSPLLSHDFLFRYPLDNVTVNVVETLNTLNLCNGVVIEEATIDQLQGFMADGKLSSVQLTICCINRVFQVERFIK